MSRHMDWFDDLSDTIDGLVSETERERDALAALLADLEEAQS